VKKSAIVLVCILLLACWAQARPSDPDAPAGDTSAAASDTSAEPADQQSPPPAAQPPADQQSPPATQPASQAPAQTGQPTILAPPELPKYPDVRMPGEAGF